MKDLDAEIDKMLMWNINVHTEPVVFQPEMKKAIKKLIKAQTQTIIYKLEKNFREIIGEDEPAERPSPDFLMGEVYGVERNELRAEQHLALTKAIETIRSEM